MTVKKLKVPKKSREFVDCKQLPACQGRFCFMELISLPLAMKMIMQLKA
jgi:hypothetical protein